MQKKKKNPGGKSVKDLAEWFLDLKKLLQKFENTDPDPDRYSWYITYLRANLWWEKRHTPSKPSWIFLEGVTPAPEEPQAGPSEGFAEEGIVVLRR